MRTITDDIEDKTCGNENTAHKNSTVSRVAGIAAFAVAAFGALWCTILFLTGKTDLDGYIYKLTGAAVSILLFVALLVFSKITRLRIPVFLDVFLKIFIICALVLGRSFDFYSLVPYWDKILHTVSGFLFFLAGLSIGSLIFGEKHRMSGKRYIVAMTVFAFLFALGTGYVWEMFEFAGDSLFSMDNQRWAEGVVGENPDGTFIVTDARGTAILDTLGDMYVNFIGAAICFALCLFRYLRRPERIREAKFIKI